MKHNYVKLLENINPQWKSMSREELTKLLEIVVSDRKITAVEAMDIVTSMQRRSFFNHFMRGFSISLIDSIRAVSTLFTAIPDRGKHSKHKNKTNALPPKSAEKFMYLILPKHLRDNLIGDLEEEYVTLIVPKFGQRYANLWYWKQVASSMWPLLKNKLFRYALIAWFGKLAAWFTGKLSS